MRVDTPDQRAFTWTHSVPSGRRDASGMRFVVTGDPVVGTPAVYAEAFTMRRGVFGGDWRTEVTRTWRFNDDTARAVAKTALDAVYGWAALKPKSASDLTALERPGTRTIEIRDEGTFNYGADAQVPNADALAAMDDALVSLFGPDTVGGVTPRVPAAR